MHNVSFAAFATWQFPFRPDERLWEQRSSLWSETQDLDLLFYSLNQNFKSLPDLQNSHPGCTLAKETLEINRPYHSLVVASNKSFMEH